MRVVNDLNRGSNNYYSQNSPSFGAVYSKCSVKLLKRFIPEIINEEGFEFAQKALNNLAQTGKRKDNLILKFKDVDQLGIGRLEVHAKKLSDKVNSFSKIDIPVDTLGLKDSQEFESLTAFVNSDSFVSKANSTLVENEKLSQSQKVRNFVNEKLNDLSQKIQDKAEAISDSISTIDESGSKRRWGVLSDLKDLFTKPTYNDKQKEEAKILAGMIDNLPTLN